MQQMFLHSQSIRREKRKSRPLIFSFEVPFRSEVCSRLSIWLKISKWTQTHYSFTQIFNILPMQSTFVLHLQTLHMFTIIWDINISSGQSYRIQLWASPTKLRCFSERKSTARQKKPEREIRTQQHLWCDLQLLFQLRLHPAPGVD